MIFLSTSTFCFSYNHKKAPQTSLGGFFHNTGLPIPTEDLPHIFERFWRVHAGSMEGHGLGLALVSTIAGFHGIGLQMQSGSDGTTVLLRWQQVAGA